MSVSVLSVLAPAPPFVLRTGVVVVPPRRRASLEFRHTRAAGLDFAHRRRASLEFRHRRRVPLAT